MATSRLVAYFEDYEKFHRTLGNRRSHVVGIPLIVVGLLGLLAGLELGWEVPGGLLRLDVGVVVVTAVSLFYIWLDLKIGVAFDFVLAGFYFLGRALNAPWAWGLFILGWILQAVGHAYYERKSPAFFKNLTHLLIGPVWIFSNVIGCAGKEEHQ